MDSSNTLFGELRKEESRLLEERAAVEYRELVRAIDKVTSRRALHRNTAARKKAQASRLLSGS